MTELDYGDKTDFENADRGFVGKLTPGTVRDDAGRVVWDIDAFAFLEGERPDSVHPSLWRQSRLCAKQGLYEVTEGVYQVRGLDLSNMTLIEGERGVVVIDPLISAETAAAALSLYREHRGERPVTGLLYTHSHIDHFGGALGVIDPDEDDVPILAPEGFMEHSVVENVYAGPAMLRRGMYYSGANLGAGTSGVVSMGLGPTVSTGTPGLVPPTVDITRTGQEEVVDGVRFVFQMTPGTEAPSEMNFLLPEHRALCMAEKATHNMHNILTLRGAVVRDARIWSRYLNEAIQLFAARADVLFASHHWPTWGRENIVRLLSEQRDLYAYMHDQTLRLLNQGLTGAEIAEDLRLPEGLETVWNTRGYYGSLSHNVKAIYQRYLGWYDGNPSSLWEHTQTESAKRYVDTIGGIDAVMAKAREYADDGDLRFAAQLLRHAVFAQPSNTDAKELLASVYQRLGEGAENATWRNCYLTGASELRDGVVHTDLASSAMATMLTVTQLFDTVSIRVDGPKAAGTSLVIDWTFTDLGESYRTQLSNGAFVHWPTEGESAGDADLTFTLTKAQLLQLLANGSADGLEHSGDPGVLGKLLSVLDEPDPNFAIITP
ncbi:MBL fold metallo-hydrolase [Nocardiopsis sp. HNM0947]|uniref:MBL fold metallo-hydrolase n=1 Tax=Nocardiopsis coralli TaxID=2772213 RepID=A0ABR9P8I1_9ACTN|nr:alkyl sulfatase dimerization domain-containing protein [Nocardiopsis coralli]MBE3000147.1 MBL fold metallo-hydrolase [Nocardiopsis coralli]